MRSIIFPAFAFFFCAASPVLAGTVYEQPHDSSGTVYQSSGMNPDGSDYDQFVWDNFRLNSTQLISEVAWRGGYRPDYFGSGGTPLNFEISFWASVNYTGSNAPYQPDLGNFFGGRLAHYAISGDAGQVPAGTFNGVAMYDYHYILPTAFQAQADTNYWIGIAADQSGIPDWGLAKGNGGDHAYFRQISAAADKYFQRVSGDTAFSLKSVTVTPEPASLLLFGLGGAALAVFGRKK